MEERIRNSFIYAFLCESKYLKDMIVLNTKSIIDDKSNKLNYIDYNRLKDELLLYKYYGEKNNKSIYNLNYILPIILCNTNFKKCEEEVINNIRFYTDKYEYVFSGIIYNYIIHSIIKDKDSNISDIISKLKEYIIEFNIDDIDIINFNKCKIYVLQKLDRFLKQDISLIKEENIIDGILRVLYQVYIQDYNEELEELKSIKNSILGILGFKLDNKNIEGFSFINSLSQYILRLRKYEINKKIYNEKVNPKDLIKLNVGDTIYNPILNNIKVIDKKLENDILYIKVLSKSGEYSFKFKRA
ncbi:hypothetical protein SAMN05661008_00467 [Alkalithermobacter thermoalcaliphilus JW-YL-7 = DSM 7308]|uniref:Uncharacterized protein n=1 Tax=Alkalithermobacter thermoalcaliphilus JW-YL-7 = DSM 7308 TaxID=1121328 RepID=A0A150FNX7_CLOPD|nr:hypothetical protein JWYL7_0424 [[Clostridium] paradoxum JW-YL-7 = DSM 7308]SHK55059.1 hypothetical protein SAMN05661008_00467 [[Clostridium] paradoxum JW-YL-7 = DSM 7308]